MNYNGKYYVVILSIPLTIDDSVEFIRQSVKDGIARRYLFRISGQYGWRICRFIPKKLLKPPYLINEYFECWRKSVINSTIRFRRLLKKYKIMDNHAKKIIQEGKLC